MMDLFIKTSAIVAWSLCGTVLALWAVSKWPWLVIF